jgi:hypothetical protein
MGRFDRKIQRRNMIHGPIVVDRPTLARAGFTLVPTDDPGLASFPPLASQLEAMAKPILDGYQDAPDPVLNTILSFVVLSWNLGFMALFDSRGATVEQLVQKQFGQALRQEAPAAREQTLAMVRSLMRMRMEFFGHDPRIIEQSSVTRQAGGYQIQASGVAALRGA